MGTQQALAWVVDQNGGVLDSHLFFYDRYAALAEYHLAEGRTSKAEKIAAVAEAYYRSAPDGEPPPAVAMAMPARRPLVNTNAVSTTSVSKPPAEPSSDLVPSTVP